MMHHIEENHVNHKLSSQTRHFYMDSITIEDNDAPPRHKIYYMSPNEASQSYNPLAKLSDNQAVDYFTNNLDIQFSWVAANKIRSLKRQQISI